ncbi:MAG: hypothetical protein GY851_13165 [bacterium]|nr:hypothetical protein [bacterium]
MATVIDLRSARRIPYARHAVLFVWFMAMALLIPLASGLLGSGNDFYVGAFAAASSVAIVLNPVGFFLLYRSLDRSPCVYRPLKDGIAGMFHVPNGPRS